MGYKGIGLLFVGIVYGDLRYNMLKFLSIEFGVLMNCLNLKSFLLIVCIKWKFLVLRRVKRELKII